VFVLLTISASFARAETEGTDYVPTIDDFDFSGDRVPWEAVKLAGEFSHATSDPICTVRGMEVTYYPCENIPDEYWIPIYDLLDVQRDYLVMGYHGPDESPGPERIARDFQDNLDNVLDDPLYKYNEIDYYKYMKYYLINWDYTANGVGGRSGIPSLVLFRLVADGMASSYFGSEDLNCQLIRFAGRDWGYKYFDVERDIYIPLTAVREKREEYWTREDVDDYLGELGDKGVFKPWDEEKTNRIREEQRAIWIEYINSILDLGFYGFSHSETDKSLYTRFNTSDYDKESGEDEQ
jgi:hypothetical protein